MDNKKCLPLDIEVGFRLATVSFAPVGEFLRIVTCYHDGKLFILTIDVDIPVRHGIW